MGLIARHANSPFVDGELLPGRDLETDISRAFAEVSGGLEDANFATAADISGTKILDGSFRGDRFRITVLASGRLAADAVVLGDFKDGAIDTARVASAAVSAVTSSVDLTTRTVDHNDGKVALDTITPTISTDAYAVILLAHAVAKNPNVFVPSGAAPWQRHGLIFRILEDGVERAIFQRDADTENDQDHYFPFIFWLDTAPTSGAITYTLEGEAVFQSQFDASVRSTSLIAIELKR